MLTFKLTTGTHLSDGVSWPILCYHLIPVTLIVMIQMDDSIYSTCLSLSLRPTVRKKPRNRVFQRKECRLGARRAC